MKRTNWKGMQLAPTVDPKTKAKQWQKPGDVNVKAMSMGSWHANSRKGGARG